MIEKIYIEKKDAGSIPVSFAIIIAVSYALSLYPVCFMVNIINFYLYLLLTGISFNLLYLFRIHFKVVINEFVNLVFYIFS